MATSETITLYYWPQTRATGIRFLLEEIGADYQLELVNIRNGDNHKPDFLAINPLGKLPTLRHGTAVVTEQIAIACYLGEIFPEAGLAPMPGDPARADYLRWLAFYGSSFEPALVDKFRGITSDDTNSSPYGSYDMVIDALEGALSKGPFLAGDRLSLADLLWGTALHWTMMFGLVPERPAFCRLRDSVLSRPLYQKVAQLDQDLVAGKI